MTPSFLKSTSPSLLEVALRTQAMCGDGTAINELFTIHRAYIRRVIDLRLEDDLRSRVDPSDIVQETQLEASNRIDEYFANRAVPFRIWLRQTVLDQIVFLRRQHIVAAKKNRNERSSLGGSLIYHVSSETTGGSAESNPAKAGVGATGASCHSTVGGTRPCNALVATSRGTDQP